jgi:hypothetical protein
VTGCEPQLDELYQRADRAFARAAAENAEALAKRVFKKVVDGDDFYLRMVMQRMWPVKPRARRARLPSMDVSQNGITTDVALSYTVTEGSSDGSAVAGPAPAAQDPSTNNSETDATTKQVEPCEPSRTELIERLKTRFDEVEKTGADASQADNEAPTLLDYMFWAYEGGIKPENEPGAPLDGIMDFKSEAYKEAVTGNRDKLSSLFDEGLERLFKTLNVDAASISELEARDLYLTHMPLCWLRHIEHELASQPPQQQSQAGKTGTA